MFRRMSEYKQDARCPQCNDDARKILSAPHLNVVDGNLRKAHQHNERNADSPPVVRKKSSDESHAHSHGHHHHVSSGLGHKHVHATSGRPWQIGH